MSNTKPALSRKSFAYLALGLLLMAGCLLAISLQPGHVRAADSLSHAIPPAIPTANPPAIPTAIAAAKTNHNTPVKTKFTPRPRPDDPRMRRNIRGLIVPKFHATISSRLQATIAAIGPGNGERFNKGGNLVTFDCAIFNAELKRAEAQLGAAMDTRNVKAELARNGTISRLQLVLANAEAKKAEAEQVLSNERVTHCTIRAPWDGRVVNRLANAHETVNVGDPLMEIVNDQEVELQLYLPSRWLKHLKKGFEFRFHVDETDAEINAEIIATGAWIDNVSQLIEVRAICNDSCTGLVAGMSGRAEFENLK